MYRRNFLQTGALAITGFSLGDPYRFPWTTVTPLRKAVKFTMIQEPGLSIAEKFHLLKELGFDGVEIESPSDLDRDEVIAARDRVGISIHGVVDSVHWQYPLSDPDPDVREAGLDGLKTAIEDARAYGASTVLLVPALVNKQVSYKDAYVRSQSEIRKVLPMASEYKVKIAFENVWNHFLLSPLECVRYVDEFESDFVGWYFDVGNVVAYGWPEQWIQSLGSRILKLDIKEYSRSIADAEGRWAGFNVPLGKGDCDWPSVNAALSEIGFQGWATAEVPGGDRARLQELADRMDRILSAP